MKGKTTMTAIGEVAGGSEEEFTKEIQTSGHVTRVRISTYVGHEFDFHYKVERIRDDTPSNVLDTMDGDVAVDHVTGNGEEFDLAVREKVEPGDTLRVTVTNVSDTDPDGPYTYHANARITVDYDLKDAVLSRIFGRSDGSNGGGLLGL